MKEVFATLLFTVTVVVFTLTAAIFINTGVIYREKNDTLLRNDFAVRDLDRLRVREINRR